MKLRLHTRYQNSAGQRVRIVLNLKGLDYEYVAVTAPSSSSYSTINPQELMPTLEADGRFIAQSMAIVEFLEERYPNPSVFPVDAFSRADVRAFSHLITSDLHPINNNRVRRYLSDIVGADDVKAAGWYAHWIERTFTSLETQLAKRSRQSVFCFSGEPTLADACLVPQISNARRFNCDLSNYPLLLGVDAQCSKLDAFVRAAPEAQPDFPG